MNKTNQMDQPVGAWARAQRVLVEPRVLPFLVFVRLAC
jgi:hypothetical protein